MPNEVDKIAAYKTLTAAFIYSLAVSGAIRVNQTVVDFGLLNLGDGNSIPRINKAFKTIFGEDAPSLEGMSDT